MSDTEAEADRDHARQVEIGGIRWIETTADRAHIDRMLERSIALAYERGHLRRG